MELASTETLDCRACKRNSTTPAAHLLYIEIKTASFWQEQLFKVEQLQFFGFYILTYTHSCSVCLQMFGCGAVAQLVLSKGTHGMFLTVNFAFGFAATLGILVCGQISGILSQSDYGPPFIPVFQPILLLMFTEMTSHLQVATWIPRSPLPCVCWGESAGGSFPCILCFRQSVPFLVLQSYSACTMVKTGSKYRKYLNTACSCGKDICCVATWKHFDGPVWFNAIVFFFKTPCSTSPELSICLEEIPQLESLLRTLEIISPF